jgi:hypothetical protein
MKTGKTDVARAQGGAAGFHQQVQAGHGARARAESLMPPLGSLTVSVSSQARQQFEGRRAAGASQNGKGSPRAVARLILFIGHKARRAGLIKGHAFAP